MSDVLNGAWDGVSVPAAARVIVRAAEGTRLVPYQDGRGIWTIGTGATRDLAGEPVTAATPALTDAQADELLARDMATAAADVEALVTVPLMVRQAAALISFDYNEGRGQFSMSTLLRELDAANVADVPNQLRQWDYAGDAPELGLLRRRWAEAAVFVGVEPRAAIGRAWSDINGFSDWPDFGVVL